MSAALYQSMTTAGSWVALGPVTAGGAYLLNVTNCGATTDTVQVALMSAAGTPAQANLIESGALLASNGVLSRYPLALDVGFVVYVKSTSNNDAATLAGRVGA